MENENLKNETVNNDKGDVSSSAIRTDSDLKQIAIDLFEGRIYCDRHLQNFDDIRMVFMPIALGAFEKSTEEEMNDIGMLFEYFDKATPRSINGMPSFFSFQILKKAETEAMFKHYEAYKELKQNFANS